MGNLRKLQEIVHRQNFVILDTETTGLKNAEICEIAVINSLGDIVMHDLVRPRLAIPTQATLIHGITNETVEHANTWESVGHILAAVIRDMDVLVYNAKFDRHMMYSSDEHWSIQRQPWREIANWHCVMESFAEYYGEFNPRYGSYTWKPLKFAAEQCGFEGTDYHRAAFDCIMTLAVVNFLAKVEVRP